MSQAESLQWEYCILTNNQTYLYYTLYQQKGPYTIKKPYTTALWSWCISTLGLLGWEAINTSYTSTASAWHFKRVFHPSNEQLQF